MLNTYSVNACQRKKWICFRPLKMKCWECLWKESFGKPSGQREPCLRRPNHMHSHLDALQAMAPVAFRRGASEVHSVAKWASFYIAFGRVSCGFRIDFGRLWGGNMEAKIDFLEVFLWCFFWMRFSIDLGWIFGGSKPEKSIKTIVFPMVFADSQKIDVFKKVAKKL